LYSFQCRASPQRERIETTFTVRKVCRSLRDSLLRGWWRALDESRCQTPGFFSSCAGTTIPSWLVGVRIPDQRERSELRASATYRQKLAEEIGRGVRERSLVARTSGREPARGQNTTVPLQPFIDQTHSGKIRTLPLDAVKAKLEAIRQSRHVKHKKIFRFRFRKTKSSTIKKKKSAPNETRIKLESPVLSSAQMRAAEQSAFARQR